MKMDNKIHHHSNWVQQWTLIIVINLCGSLSKKSFCVVGETGEMEFSWKFLYVPPLYCANLSISVFILGNFLMPHPPYCTNLPINLFVLGDVSNTVPE